jgi:hypothetical protein
VVHCCRRRAVAINLIASELFAWGLRLPESLMCRAAIRHPGVFSLTYGRRSGAGPPSQEWSPQMKKLLLAILPWLFINAAYAQTATQLSGTEARAERRDSHSDTTRQSPRRGMLSRHTPCDFGPPVMAIPAAAQAAGLTHCVANFDFSQPTYAEGAPKPWFDCMGESANTAGIIWHGGSAGIGEESPCNIHQVKDPQTGALVEDFQWLPAPSFKHGSARGEWQANQVALQTNNMYLGQTYHPTMSVPNYYLTTTVRLPANCNGCVSNAGGPADIYMWGFLNSPDGGGLEIDSPELQTNPRGGSGSGVAAGNCGLCANGSPYWSNWGANQKNLPPGYNSSNYNTYDAMLTSDGKTSQLVCMYINGILQNDTGCQTAKNNAGGTDTGHFGNRSYLTIGTSSNNGAALFPMDLYVQNVVLFSCASYQTGQCNGTTLASRTLPTGQTLQYWH